MTAVFACNQFVDTEAPWALRKTDPDRMAAVLGTLFRAIRDLAAAVAPVVPRAADTLLTAMGASGSGSAGWYERLAGSDFRLAAPVPIFPRLDPPEA
jgi:methionyl-tRNA synthetase